MITLYRRAARTDVHRMKQLATILIELEDGSTETHTREFDGFKRDLCGVVAWLKLHDGHSASGRGRPKKHVPKIPVAIEYVLSTEIIEKHEAVAKRRQLAGCFFLLSNPPGEGEGGYSAEQILRTYKEQHAIEKNFSLSSETTRSSTLFHGDLEIQQTLRASIASGIDRGQVLAGRETRTPSKSSLSWAGVVTMKQTVTAVGAASRRDKAAQYPEDSRRGQRPLPQQ